MQSMRTRTICRAHNRFTLSIAWWQHAVPTRLQGLRYASSAARTVYDSGVDNGQVSGPVGSSRIEPLQVTGVGTASDGKDTESRVRRIKTHKGNWQQENPKGTPQKKNQPARQDHKFPVSQQTDRLLSDARAAFKQAVEYKGVVVKPIVNPQPIKESQLPWCLLPQDRNILGIERLVVEMERFFNYAVPSRYETLARKHVIEQVRDYVCAALPNYTLEVFGSERTGLALATSDIDFRLIPLSQTTDTEMNTLPPKPEQRSQALKTLEKLRQKALHCRGRYLMPQLRYARYPLVSLQDRESGLDLQIVSSNDTTITRKFISDYSEEYSYLLQLYCIVKTIFDIRGLSDVFRGGFGSYPLFMMIVASIRHNPHPRSDAAGGLLNFLQFWCDFDTVNKGVSIEPIAFFDKTTQPVVTNTVKSRMKNGTLDPLPTFMLSLRDPADETNDLGRKGIAIKHVQATFRALLQQLTMDMRDNERPSLLGPLVGACYMLNHARRAKLDSYGRQIATRIDLALTAKAKAIRESVTEEQERGVRGIPAS